MRIQILSDLHIEHAPFIATQTQADVIVLAGDIGPKMRGLTLALEQFPEQRVIYVAGNHEYYGTALPHLTSKLQLASKSTHVSFLENEECIVNEVRFLGCTLWTAFDLFGPEKNEFCRWEAEERLNDYRKIRRSPQFRCIKAYDTAALHAESRHWLVAKLEEPFAGKTVVVTHHAPSARSIPAEEAGELLAAAYASYLDAWCDGKAIDLWIHGHTHHALDYQLGKTRVVCNPRGYPGEVIVGFDPAFVVEI